MNLCSKSTRIVKYYAFDKSSYRNIKPWEMGIIYPKNPPKYRLRSPIQPASCQCLPRFFLKTANIECYKCVILCNVICKFQLSHQVFVALETMNGEFRFQRFLFFNRLFGGFYEKDKKFNTFQFRIITGR
jgi:hypothetical protein